MSYKSCFFENDNQDSTTGFFKNGKKIGKVISRFDLKRDDGKWLSLNPLKCGNYKSNAGFGNRGGGYLREYFGEMRDNKPNGRGIGIWYHNCIELGYWKNDHLDTGDFLDTDRRFLVRVGKIEK